MSGIRRTHYINGGWLPAHGTALIEVDNPVDGSLVGAVPAGDAVDVDRAVAAARAAFAAWSATSMERRIAVIEALAALLDRDRDNLAAILTSEMGSPIAFARQAQVGVAIADLHALVAAARAHQERASVSNSLVVSEAIGVVAAITPWNFPLHQIALKVGAALLAGCTVVLKPSEVAPLNAVRLAELMAELDLPAGTFNVVFGDGRAGEPLAAHRDVDMVTFTGSRAVGERVAVAAARTITKVALELGGKSAAVILDDAPVDDSVAGVLRSCFANAGQTCAALTRVLVPNVMKAEWESAAVAALTSWQLGDPAAEGTAVGPLASHKQQGIVRGFISRAIDDGARVLAGGARVAEEFEAGAYVLPTIFTDVTPELAIFRE